MKKLHSPRTPKRLKTLLGSSAVALALSTACQAAQYISLDVPGASDTFPQAINKYGVITGNYCAGACGGFVRTPDGTITTFKAGTGSTAALAINSDRTVTASGLNDRNWVLGYYSGQDRHTHGFLRVP